MSHLIQHALSYSTSTKTNISSVPKSYKHEKSLHLSIYRQCRRIFREFSEGIRNCLGVCRSCIANSSYRQFQEKYYFNCNQFPALCHGRLFCTSLFLTWVLISLLCCASYRSTVLNLSKQILTWTDGFFQIVRKGRNNTPAIYFRRKNHSKRY